MVKSNKPVALFQKDPRWSKNYFLKDNTQTVGNSGSILVTFSMLLNAHLGLIVLPDELEKMSIDMKINSQDFNKCFIKAASKKYHLRLLQTENITIAKHYLKHNALVICSTISRANKDKNFFGSKEHFILISGFSNNINFNIYDPSARSRSDITVNEDLIAEECNYYYIFLKPGLAGKLLSLIYGNKSKSAKVIAPQLCVRDKPSPFTDSNILGTLEQGDYINLNGIENGWAEINYSGQKAYINANNQYLKWR